MTHPQISRLDDNVFFIEAPYKGRFPYCNGFVFTGKETILIDAGLGDDLMHEVDRMFHIDTLLITHSHPDHIRSWDVFQNKRLLYPKETPEAVMDLEKLGSHYTGSDETGRHWVNIIGKPFGIKPMREPDDRYKDGDIIDNGAARLQAIHAPGHYNDHYCFLDHTSGTLITTDIDFTSFGPWYGNPEGRIKPFQDSIKKIMTLPYNRACSSHKTPIEGNAETQFQEFLACFDRQKEDVLKCIGSGKTLKEMVDVSPYYNNRFLDLKIQHVFEGHMIEENLAALLKEGRIKKENGLYTPILD